MDWVEARFCDDPVWISGIYKVRTYDGVKFHAFYIPDWYKNWGDYVCQPPLKDDRGCAYWPSLDAAKADCEKHAQTHVPSKRTKQRADEILKSFLAV